MTEASQPTGAAAFVWPLQYIGDDWAFPYTFTNLDGTAIDLTGATPRATLFGYGRVAPAFEMDGLPAVTIVDPAAGKVVFRVGRDLTATLRADGNRRDYPTRIQVMLLDSAGVLKTFRVDGLQVEDARFVPITAGA